MTVNEIYVRLKGAYSFDDGIYLSNRDFMEIAHSIYGYSETGYLLSTEANKERLESAIEEYKDALKGSDKITPKALLGLGFREEYQKPDCGDAGFIYYALNADSMLLLSTASNESEFFVYTDEDTKITSLEKLTNLVNVLQSL
tara:strand:- start:2001 stop:2429 length:429 start_codon:yes stop_codon:yes gene_type:complete